MSGTQQLPRPPIPVMPDTGQVPVTQQIDRTGQDALSPTTMVLNYLKERGFQPTSENVRRALEANARDPGVIEGLRSDTSATNDPVGAGGGARLPVPPIPPVLERPNQSMVPPAAAAVSTGVGGGDGGSGSDKAIAGLGAILPSIASLILGGRTPPRSPIPGPAAIPPPAGAPLALPAPPLQLEAPAKQITGPPPAAEAPVAKSGEAIPLGDERSWREKYPNLGKDPVADRIVPNEDPTKAAIDKAVPADAPVPPKKPRIRARAGRAVIR